MLWVVVREISEGGYWGDLHPCRQDLARLQQPILHSGSLRAATLCVLQYPSVYFPASSRNLFCFSSGQYRLLILKTCTTRDGQNTVVLSQISLCNPGTDFAFPLQNEGGNEVTKKDGFSYILVERET